MIVINLSFSTNSNGATYRSLRIKKLNHIHMHLCLSLLVGYCTFIFGVERPKPYMTCMVVGAIIQFSFLSAWGWMVTEFYVMYRLNTKNFQVQSDGHTSVSCSDIPNQQVAIANSLTPKIFHEQDDFPSLISHIFYCS